MIPRSKNRNDNELATGKNNADSEIVHKAKESQERFAKAKQKRAEAELAQSQVSIDALTHVIGQKNEKLFGLVAERERLQRECDQLTSRIEEVEAYVVTDTEKKERLEQKLAELDAIEARKKRMLEDADCLEKAEAELKVLESKYKELIGRVSSTSQKYELTKCRIDEMEKNLNPINQAIMDVWKKHEPDELDKKLEHLLNTLQKK